MARPLRVLVLGAGEHASGTACRLFRCGFRVAMTELPTPLAVRRGVSFSSAVTEGTFEVEGVPARRWALGEAAGLDAADHVAVFVDPEATLVGAWSPDVVVDARLLKHGGGTTPGMAPLVVGLGPGLRVGREAHVVVETHRGHDLGRLLRAGEAAADTGVPGPLGGYAAERVLRAPRAGTLEARRDIGEVVVPGELVARVDGAEVRTPIGGVLRGLLHPGFPVTGGLKIGDVDPRGDVAACFSLSDKTRTLSGAVLEAILARFPAAARTRPPVSGAPDGLLTVLPPAPHVQVVGSGGKTSLLFAWADALVRAGRRVITTTSTRIRFPDPERSPWVVVEPEPDRLRGRLAEVLPRAGHATAAPGVVPGVPKLVGFAPDALDDLATTGLADHLLVEADGAAGFLVKAHRAHEPVLSPGADQVVLVVGLAGLGRPVGEVAHCPELAAARMGVTPPDPVTPERLATLLLHPEEALARVAAGVPVDLLLTGVVDGTGQAAASTLAARLGGRVQRVVAGDLRDPAAGLRVVR